MDTNTSFGFKEEVINFSWNSGSETLPHPVAGVCPLNVTTCPRALNSLFPSLLSLPYAAGVGLAPPWGRCPRNYFISPPCPYSLIAPQQTCAAGNLPAVRAQGFCLGFWFGEVVGEMGRSEIVLSALTLLAAHWGDLLALFPGSQCPSLLFTKL